MTDDGVEGFARQLLRVAGASKKAAAQHNPCVVRKESACLLDPRAMETDTQNKQPQTAEALWRLPLSYGGMPLT